MILTSNIDSKNKKCSIFIISPLLFFYKISKLCWIPELETHKPNKGYTANLLTAKSTGFTCVPFSTVLPLSFWQSTTVCSEPLQFNRTKDFQCLFSYNSEPKILLLPVKNTIITSQKYSYYLSKIPLLPVKNAFITCQKKLRITCQKCNSN